MTYGFKRGNSGRILATTKKKRIAEKYGGITLTEMNNSDWISKYKIIAWKALFKVCGPMCFAVAANCADVTIAWNANPEPPPTGYGPTGGYKVYWGTQSGLWPMSQNSGLQTTNTVTGLTNGVTYYFVVKAYNQDAESGPSSEISYSVPLLPPPSPGGLRVLSGTLHATMKFENLKINNDTVEVPRIVMDFNSQNSGNPR